jgi:Chaperone of endosialidase
MKYISFNFSTRNRFAQIFGCMIGLLLLCASDMLAQAPQKFRYQAVARNPSGVPYANTNLKIRFQILQGSDSGPSVFYEEHTVNTTNLGVFEANIGGGTIYQGTIANIDWSNNTYFVKVELNTNPNNGGTFVTMGASQLLSVPYAMYAERSGGGGGGGTNQNLSISGNQLSISGGNSIQLPTEIDGSTSNELQQLSINGNQLTLSQNGGTVTLPGGGGGGPVYSAGNGISLNNNTITNTGDNDNNSGNELQQLSINGNQLTLSQSGGTVTLPGGGGGGPVYSAGNGISINNNVITNTGDGDNNTGNELQQITLVGNQLTLSQSGGSVTLPTGTTYTAGSGIAINGNAITAIDASASNEIQQLSLSGNQLQLSQGGGTVTLPGGGGLTLPYSGSANTANLNPAFLVTNTGSGMAIRAQNNNSSNFADLGTSMYAADLWGPQRIVNPGSSSDLFISNTTGNGSKIELEANGGNWKMQAFNDNFNLLNANSNGMWLSPDNVYFNESSLLLYRSSDPAEVELISDNGQSGAAVRFRSRTGAQNRSGLSGTDQYLIIETGGTSRIDITHAAQYTMEPWDNASVDLGRSAYRWDFLYCVGVNQSSDARLKTQIESITPGLSAIMQMRPVNYYWKDKKMGTERQYGFIAQELEQVLPDIVTHDVLTENDLNALRESGKPTPEITDPYGINYTAITPVLVKGMQEQQAKIEQLEKELAELKLLVEQLVKK